MDSQRFSLRSLYLLALLQLVAGPLVLVTVLTFCKVAVREAPQQGLAKAMSSAWTSHEVQTALQSVSDELGDTSKSAPLKVTKEKLKLIGIAWAELRMVPHEGVCPCVMARGEVWTPVWPQAPPGEPPRIG